MQELSFTYTFSVCVKNIPAMQDTLGWESRGLGKPAGEGIGYPLQYSWASLVAQLVKNTPVMRETCTGFPRGDPALQADSLQSEPPGKPRNTGVGSLSLLQWIFPTQESNQGQIGRASCRERV